MCFFDREDSLMMHKESPPSKNSFLEDLDKLDVSFHSQIKTLIQYGDVCDAFFFSEFTALPVSSLDS